VSGKGYKFQKKSSYLFTGTETKQSAEIVKTILLRMPYNAETAQRTNWLTFNIKLTV